MKRTQEIINEELLREDFINNVTSTLSNGWQKTKDLYNKHVAPTVNKVITKVSTFVSDIVGDPVNNAGKYGNISIPKITSLGDLAKLKTCKNHNGRTKIKNAYVDNFKRDPKNGEGVLDKFTLKPYIELTTYKIMSKKYVTSHSELKIVFLGGLIEGVLDTYIDDADYAFTSNNCATATSACISAALGNVKKTFTLPTDVMAWFRDSLGAKTIQNNVNGCFKHRLDVRLLQSIRGLFYIYTYIKRGGKH